MCVFIRVKKKIKKKKKKKQRKLYTGLKHCLCQMPSSYFQADLWGKHKNSSKTISGESDGQIQSASLCCHTSVLQRSLLCREGIALRSAVIAHGGTRDVSADLCCDLENTKTQVMRKKKKHKLYSKIGMKLEH